MAAASLVRGSDGRVDGRFAGDGEGRAAMPSAASRSSQPVGVTSCATGDEPNACRPNSRDCRAASRSVPGPKNDAGGGGAIEAHRI